LEVEVATLPITIKQPHLQQQSQPPRKAVGRSKMQK
jgi:hypothetical protein